MTFPKLLIYGQLSKVGSLLGSFFIRVPYYFGNLKRTLIYRTTHITTYGAVRYVLKSQLLTPQALPLKTKYYKKS